MSAKLFEGFTPDDIEWIGGESPINETVGLGGFAQAAAFPLQNYQGGSPEAMIEMNLAMYDITVGENTDYKIPYLRYRGTPTGIDVLKVVADRHHAGARRRPGRPRRRADRRGRRARPAGVLPGRRRCLRWPATARLRRPPGRGLAPGPGGRARCGRP